jgi:hypothetical protein
LFFPFAAETPAKGKISRLQDHLFLVRRPLNGKPKEVSALRLCALSAAGGENEFRFLLGLRGYL